MRLPVKAAASSAPAILGKTVGTSSAAGGGAESRRWNRERMRRGLRAKLAQETQTGKRGRTGLGQFARGILIRHRFNRLRKKSLRGEQLNLSG